MNPVVAFLKLIRFPNLLIIALTQYLIRWCIISPMLTKQAVEKGVSLQSQMSEMDFFLLCISTVMIAAAGYIINDYFDLRTDRINKPEKIIVGRHIKRRVAMGAHMTINALGLLLGAYVALKVGVWKLVFVHIFASASLWFYSTNFKRQLIIGNVVIALLAGLIPLVVGLFEITLLNAHYHKILRIYEMSFNTIAYWVLGYAFFAFLFTLVREVTKDVMDMKGDEANACLTIPIVWGVKKTKVIIISMYVVILVLLLFTQQRFLNDSFTALYFLIAFVVPILFIIYQMVSIKRSSVFATASLLNKIVSVLGILYAIPVGYWIGY